MATSIARALEIELTSDERQRIERTPTSNQEAYQLYLRGRYFWNRRTFEDLDRALDLFQQAVAADPGFALAHVGIAETYLLLPHYGEYPRADGTQRAEAAARQALKFDPTSGEAYATLGAVAHERWQWDRADQFYIRAVELSPGYATGHQWYGEYLYSVGRTREAVVEAERAHELDPQSMIIMTVLAVGYYYDRRYEEAIATARAATEMTDEVVNPYGALLLALQETHRFPEAIETLSTMMRMMAGDEAGERLSAELARDWREQGERGYWEAAAGIYQTLGSGQGQGPTVPVAVAYLHAGDRERAFDWLERSIEQRSAGTPPDNFFDPGLDPIRDDPRFVRLLERMGLSPSSPR